MIHNRREWIGVYGDLLRMDETLRKDSITTSLYTLILSVLIMLVEDKIKEREK